MKTQNIKKGINLGIYLTIATVTLGLMLVAPSLNNKIFAASLEPSMNKLTTFNIGAGSKKDVRANGYYEEQNRLNELYKLFSVNQKLTDAQYRNYKYQDITENKQKGNIYDQITAPYDIFPKFKEPGKLHDPIGKRTLKFAVTDGYSLDDFYYNPGIFCIDRRRSIHDGTPDRNRGLSKNPINTGKSLDELQMKEHIKSYIKELKPVLKHGDELTDFQLTDSDYEKIVERIMVIMTGADTNAEYGGDIEDITHLNGGSANVGESVPYDQITIGEIALNKQIAGGREGAIIKGATRTGSSIEYDEKTWLMYIGGAISSRVSKALGRTHSGTLAHPQGKVHFKESDIFDDHASASGKTAVKTGLKALLKSQTAFREDEAYLAFLLSDYEQRKYGSSEAINNYENRYSGEKVARAEPMQFVVWDSAVSYHGPNDEKFVPKDPQAVQLQKDAEDFKNYVNKLIEFTKQEREEENSGYQRILYSKIYHKHIKIERESRRHNHKVGLASDPESVIIRNPKFKYEPRIYPGKDYTMEEASFAKFDTENQKWILGPYKLDYLNYKTGDKEKGTEKYLSGLTSIKLYGKYTDDNGNVTPEANKPVEAGNQFQIKNDKKPTREFVYDNNGNPMKKARKNINLNNSIKPPLPKVDDLYTTDPIDEDTDADIAKFESEFKVDAFKGGRLEKFRRGQAYSSVILRNGTTPERKVAMKKVYDRIEKSFTKWIYKPKHETYELIPKGVLDQKDVENMLKAYLKDNKYIQIINQKMFEITREEKEKDGVKFDKWIIKKIKNSEKDIEKRKKEFEYVDNIINNSVNNVPYPEKMFIEDTEILTKQEKVNGEWHTYQVEKTYSVYDRLHLRVSKETYETAMRNIINNNNISNTQKYFEQIKYILPNINLLGGTTVEATQGFIEEVKERNKTISKIEQKYISNVLNRIQEKAPYFKKLALYSLGYNSFDLPVKYVYYTGEDRKKEHRPDYTIGIEAFSEELVHVEMVNDERIVFTHEKIEQYIEKYYASLYTYAYFKAHVVSDDKDRNNYYINFSIHFVNEDKNLAEKLKKKDHIWVRISSPDDDLNMKIKLPLNAYEGVIAEYRFKDYPNNGWEMNLIVDLIDLEGYKAVSVGFNEDETTQTLDNVINPGNMIDWRNDAITAAKIFIRKGGGNVSSEPEPSTENLTPQNPNNPNENWNNTTPPTQQEEEIKKQAQQDAIWAIDQEETEDNTGYVTEDELIAYEKDKDKFNIAEEYNREGLTEVKKWQIVTEKEKQEGQMLEPNEEFYFVIDYDPALASIARAKFEFTYMIFGGARRIYQTYAGHFSGLTIHVDSDIMAEDTTITKYYYKGNTLVEYSEPATDVSPDFIAYISGEIDGSMDQQQTNMEVEAMRWYEDIALELRFTDKNSYGLLLRTPIGGKVWEDRQGVERKHVGYNNLLDINNNEHPDKMVSGIKVTIFRNFVKFGANKSVEEIISREFARLYKVDTDEQIKPEEAQRIFTNDKGEYGPYDIHDIGFTQDELKNYNTKDYGVVFDVRFDYDGMYYEPVTPMQLPDAEVYKEAKQSVEAVENFNKMSSADKKLFARSSFAFENIKERDRFNSVNASIAGERSITQDKKTVGKTLTIESGNVEGRVNTPRLIEYEKGNDVGTSKRVERVESKYVKEVPKEALIGNKKVNSFDEYANKFVSASTINIGIKLPANEKIVFKTEKDQSIPEKIAKFQGIYYSSKAYMKNINLGLRRRKPVQLAVIKSINNAVVTVNKKAYNYVYNDLHLEMRSEREKAEGLGTMIDLPKYQNTVENNQIDRILELYKTDYIYRTAMYSGNKELAEVMKRQINELDKKDGNDADREDTRQLDVFVTYRVNVFNHSPVDTVMLNAIDDYYNNKMELVNKSIKKYIENDPKSNITQEGLNVDIHGDAKNELEIAKGRYVVFDKNDKSKKPKPYIGKIDGRNVFEIEDKKWDKQQERLYKQKVQLPSYLDMSRIEGKDKNMILKPDESMDIYLTFRVKNAKDIQTVASTDGESLGTLNGNTGIKTLTNALNLGDFENVVEIARFTTYDTLTGKASAKFDEFSAPDNVDLNGLKEGRKVKFESDTYSAPLITLQIPKETNDIKTNRTITGLLWEDKRNKENRGILTGDGTFEAGEAPIPDTPITLEERISISRKLLNGSNSNTSGFFSNGNGLKYTTENFDDGSKFIDIPFIWPNHIKGKGIEIDLKTVTGFESTVVTDINGNYTFTGVPSGNMIVSMDYTSPNKKIKAFLYDNANREAKSIEHIIEETEAIHVNDLIKTANSVDRDVKYYNGMDFKNTMFNVTNSGSLNQTWIDKKDRDYNVSLLRDDEYRRLKVAKNFEIINNANSKYVDIFRGKIDTFNNDRELDEAVGMAHKLSTMRATTPKMNFSVEFYENSENLDFNNLHVSKIAEYDNLYNIIGDTENNIRDKNYKIENINLGIVERPNTKLVLNKEITGISVVTSNGEKPIDINFNIKAKVNKATKNTNVEYGNSGETESTIEFAREVDMASSTGLDYVLSLDRTQKLDGILESAKPGRSERELKNELLKGGFRYINIDKNIMQDAGISIRYGIFAYNLGEIDRKIDLERAISDKIIEPVNISDYDIEINRRTAKENAYRIGPNANQGKLNIEATTNDNFGKYVGLEYYVLTGNNKLTEEEISKISVTEVMDLTDTSTEVNVDDLYNKSWSRADKKDLIGKVQNIERSEAELINNNGEKYIQELDNSNNIDSSVYLTKTARLEMIPFKAIDNDIEQYKLMYNGKEGYLTDEENREHKFGVRWNIKTDKTISSQSDRKELAFDNIAEVVGYHSGTGRRDPKSTPGNVNVLIDKNSGHGGGRVPGKDVTGINIPHDNTSWMKPITNNSNGPDEIISKATGREHDASSAESVTLSPPTGLGIETKATNTAIIVTTVFILGAITIVVLQSKKQ